LSKVFFSKLVFGVFFCCFCSLALVFPVKAAAAPYGGIDVWFYIDVDGNGDWNPNIDSNLDSTILGGIQTNINIPNYTTYRYLGGKEWEKWAAIENGCHNDTQQCNKGSGTSSCPFGDGDGGCKNIVGHCLNNCSANIRNNFLSGVMPTATLQDGFVIGADNKTQANATIRFDLPAGWAISRIKYNEGSGSNVLETSSNQFDTVLNCRNCAGYEFSMQNRLIKVGIGQPPDPPYSLTATCNMTTMGLQAKFDWEVPANVASFDVRIDDTISDWRCNQSPVPSDCCRNPSQFDVCEDKYPSSYYNLTGIAGHRYNWWVHSVGRSGIRSQAVQGPALACNCSDSGCGMLDIRNGSLSNFECGNEFKVWSNDPNPPTDPADEKLKFWPENEAARKGNWSLHAVYKGYTPPPFHYWLGTWALKRTTASAPYLITGESASFRGWYKIINEGDKKTSLRACLAYWNLDGTNMTEKCQPLDNSLSSEWKQFEVIGPVAPKDVYEIRPAFIFNNGSNTAMEVLFDWLCLTGVPYVDVYAQDSGGNLTPVSLEGVYRDRGLASMSYSSCVDCSRYNDHAVAQENAGGLFLLKDDQVLLGVTPIPSGGTQGTIDIGGSGYTSYEWNKWDEGGRQLHVIVGSPTPTPVAPVCSLLHADFMDISPSPDLGVNDSVVFTCNADKNSGNIDHVNFRYFWRSTAADPWGSPNNFAKVDVAGGARSGSANLVIPSYGDYIVQCQVCALENDSLCSVWEETNVFP